MPQAQDLLEKLAEILLYNFHREHILLKLKIKKLLRKIRSKTYQLEFNAIVDANSIDPDKQQSIMCLHCLT